MEREAISTPLPAWEGWWRDRHGDWDWAECRAANERQAEQAIRQGNAISGCRRVIVTRKVRQ